MTEGSPHPSIATAHPAVRVLHLSDIHCGRAFVAQHVVAAETLAAATPFNAIVVSGDFSQRARVREFEQARVILDRLRDIAPTLVVPGNHDTAWWRAPFGIGDASRLHEDYQSSISAELEPTLRVPGVSIVGMNSAQGMLPPAMTWYPRDWRVKGGLTNAQLNSASRRIAESPAGDLRLLVVHHNIVRGRLSNRWGLKHPEATLQRIAAMHPHVVCTGHDHEERAELIQHPLSQFIVSCANTLSNRVRHHRPASLNVIEATANAVTVTVWTFKDGEFVPGPMTATLGR